MSRRTIAAQQQRLAAEQVLYAKQCHFWARSMERNDADMAAVTELNHSLSTVKNLIVKESGELTLLDLGEGKLRLAPDGSDVLVKTIVKEKKKGGENDEEENQFKTKVTVEPVPETEMPFDQRELCIDFLLRRKLRRKLLSRIARRLNRVAASMDGSTDIAAPAPPKYGDLRMVCDDKAVEEFYQLQILKDAALQRIQAAREKIDTQNLLLKEAAETKAKEEGEQDDEINNKGEEDEIKSEDEDMKNADGEIKNEEPAPEKVSTEQEPKPETSSSDVPSQVNIDEPDPLMADFETIKDYKEAFEKTVNSLSRGDLVRTATYKILEDKPEEDYVIMKHGTGIGALNHGMTAKEKEIEFKRWQTTLLARIPEQPTWADLGLENRVFYKDERRKRALEKIKEEERAKKQAKVKEIAKGEDAMEIDDDGSEKTDENEEVKVDSETSDDGAEEPKVSDSKAEEEEDGKEEKGQVSADDSPTKKDDDDDEVVVGKKEKEDEVEEQGSEKEDERAKQDENVPPKILRPISLAAIPSFHDQDLLRIKTIQSDMLASSLRDHARRRLEESTGEYNLALRSSREIQDRRSHLQGQINNVLHEQRNLELHFSGEYSVQLAYAKNQWNHNRLQFENNRLNAVLPTRNGRPVQGTQQTRNFTSIPDRTGVAENVGACVGEIVDVVEGIAQGRIRDERFSEGFVPPPLPAGLDANRMQLLKQMEATSRAEMNELTLRLGQSEEVRKKAWKKLLKTKVEFDIPHQHLASNGAVQMLQLNMQTYNSIPLPHIHHSGYQRVPEYAGNHVHVASYVPRHSSSGLSTLTTDGQKVNSEYSATRVRQRIEAESTVASASTPTTKGEES